MHRKQVLILYAVLGITAALLAWRLTAEWKRANLRYGAAAQPKVESSVSLPVSIPRAAATPTQSDIVAKNLFSADRNSEIAVESKPQPPPPLPIVFGTINLGGSYEALMAEKGQPKLAFRRIRTGERMGSYSVVEIGDEKVVVEYQGQKTTVDVYQSANSVPRADTRTAASPAPVVESVAAPPPQPAASPQPPSRPTSANAQPAVDYSGVRVTVEGNRRRMERQTPFGPQVWYEDIQNQ